MSKMVDKQPNVLIYLEELFYTGKYISADNNGLGATIQMQRTSESVFTH